MEERKKEDYLNQMKEENMLDIPSGQGTCSHADPIRLHSYVPAITSPSHLWPDWQ